MNLECQYVSGNTCAVREPATGHSVPLNVSVTLPNGLTDARISRSIDVRCCSMAVARSCFSLAFIVDRKPGTLHFEVTRDQVEEMLKPGVARSYSGTVTVIWDSEVG